MATASALHVEVVSRLGHHASAWDALVEAMPLPTPFLRSWWLDATAGPRPCLLLALDAEGGLAGGVALEERRRLGVSHLGALGGGPLCPDHLDLVAAPCRQEAVEAALRGWLARRGSRVLDIAGAVDGAALLRVLPGRVRRDVIDVAPWLPLAPAGATLGSSLARRVRRAESGLRREAGGCSVVHVDDPARALATVRRLHTERWGADSGFLVAFDRFAEAAAAGMACGELRVHELRAGAEAVAVLVCFEVAGRLSHYQGGRSLDRRWSGAGTALLARVLEDAAARGLVEADLLRGDEPYKRDFAARQRPVLRLRAAAGVRGRALLLMLRVAEDGRRRGAAAARRLRRR